MKHSSGVKHGDLQGSEEAEAPGQPFWKVRQGKDASVDSIPAPPRGRERAHPPGPAMLRNGSGWGPGHEVDEQAISLPLVFETVT